MSSRSQSSDHSGRCNETRQRGQKPVLRAPNSVPKPLSNLHITGDLLGKQTGKLQAQHPATAALLPLYVLFGTCFPQKPLASSLQAKCLTAEHSQSRLQAPGSIVSLWFSFCARQ